MTTSQVTVAEMAAGSLAAVRIFEKLGIDYCCGGRQPLEDVCLQKGLDYPAVQQELENALKTREAGERDWTAERLSDLISHIVTTHHEYLQSELPAISARLDKVTRVYTGRNLTAGIEGLQPVFEALKAELEQHLWKEENILFPAVAAYERAASSGSALPPVPFGSVNNPIRMMEHEHDGAGEALARIREITADFAVPEYACVTFRALMSSLHELETDLHMHIHLENNVLFPRAAALEASGR